MAYKYYGEHSYLQGKLYASFPQLPDEVSNKFYTDFTVGKLRGEILDMRKVFPYMYCANIDALNYSIEDGKKFYEEYFFELRGCSTVKLGKYIGRNLDWNYDERASIVLTLSKNGKSAQGLSNTCCVHNLDYFTDAFANTLSWVEGMNILPWLTMDGMNSAKLFISMHVVTDMEGQITDTFPGKSKMPVYMLPRLVLDAVDDLTKLPEFCQQYSWWARPGHEVQFFVSQGEDHMVISFKNDQIHYFTNLTTDEVFEAWPDDSCVALTNFKFPDWNGDLVTGLEHGPIDPQETTLSAHAMGTERYDIIKTFASTFDPDDQAVDIQYIAESIMKSLYYTNAYTAPWYSEFAGVYDEDLGGDLTIYRSASDYATIMSIVSDWFNSRTRDGKTWYTKYSTVYDTEEGILLVQDESGNSEYFDISDFEKGGNSDGI